MNRKMFNFKIPWLVLWLAFVLRWCSGVKDVLSELNTTCFQGPRSHGKLQLVKYSFSKGTITFYAPLKSHLALSLAIANVIHHYNI